MSLLKKFLSSNFSKYEDEQKKRYKKYVKSQKKDAKVIQITDEELYEDTIERNKSVRESRRRAPVPSQELIFKEPSPGLTLGPAPAILEAINRYVTVERVPEAHLKDIVLRYVVPNSTYKDCDKVVEHREVVVIADKSHGSNVKIKEIPSIPKRKKWRKSVDDTNEMMGGQLETKREENVEMNLHDVVEKHQVLEINRVSFSTTNSDMFYDCIDESPTSDPFDDVDLLIKEEIRRDDTSRSDDFHENRISSEEITLEDNITSLQEALLQSSLGPQCHISLNEEINNAWIQQTPIRADMDEKKVEDLRIISSSIETPIVIKEPEESENSNKIIKLESAIPNQSNFHQIEPTAEVDTIFFSSESEDEDAPIESFNDFVIIEPVVKPSLQVSQEKIEFDEGSFDEGNFDEAKANNMIIFSDNSYEDDEGIILDGGSQQKQNGRHESSSSEDDVFKLNTNRKVNFDFGNSFCTTYEPARLASSSSSDEASLTSTTTDEDNGQVYKFSAASNKIYFDAPPAYRDVAEMYNQKDHICKNFGVSSNQNESKPIESIYQNAQTMDLALLNCKNGYKETDEELDQFSESESVDLDINKDKKFQEYYDNIGDFNGEKTNPQIQRQSSILEIEDDLVEIKKLDDVVTQIDRIQDVLNKIQSQIELLESRNDDNYSSLLKTLLSSIRIMGSLNCNFDEELLRFQQDTMEHINRCIQSLKNL